MTVQDQVRAAIRAALSDGNGRERLIDDDAIAVAYERLHGRPLNRNEVARHRLVIERRADAPLIRLPEKRNGKLQFRSRRPTDRPTVRHGGVCSSSRCEAAAVFRLGGWLCCKQHLPTMLLEDVEPGGLAQVRVL